MISKKAMRPWLALGLAALLAGCSTSKAPEAPAPAPVKVKIGLALGGGAAKGFAHIGVIKVLEGAG
ncbi:patatin-like phospholipase family protein, partial (plasmid) [Chromobacterium amazonense]|nr:patatin-like phospholipase family protein [Chromobacterium amazonense]